MATHRIPDSIPNVIIDDLKIERRAQQNKFGDQAGIPSGTSKVRYHNTLGEFRSSCDRATEKGNLTWRHILLEEVYEALVEETPDKLRAELIQCAAVCIAWIEALDKRRK